MGCCTESTDSMSKLLKRGALGGYMGEYDKGGY